MEIWKYKYVKTGILLVTFRFVLYWWTNVCVKWAAGRLLRLQCCDFRRCQWTPHGGLGAGVSVRELLPPLSLLSPSSLPPLPPLSLLSLLGLSSHSSVSAPALSLVCVLREARQYVSEAAWGREDDPIGLKLGATMDTGEPWLLRWGFKLNTGETWTLSQLPERRKETISVYYLFSLSDWMFVCVPSDPVCHTQVRNYSPSSVWPTAPMFATSRLHLWHFTLVF